MRSERSELKKFNFFIEFFFIDVFLLKSFHLHLWIKTLISLKKNPVFRDEECSCVAQW